LRRLNDLEPVGPCTLRIVRHDTGQQKLGFASECMAVVDRKGTVVFLLLTFGITFVYEECLVASGMSMDFGLTSPGPMPPVRTDSTSLSGESLQGPTAHR
jgi:hypothetical protein